MLQVAEEFAEFLSILSDHDVRSYLEIGSKYGGTLFRVGMAMPEKSKCVSVDLPRNQGTASYNSIHATQRWLQGHKRQCMLIWGNSQNWHVVKQADRLAPFDAVFIDADHSYDGARKDWLNYGPMAAKLVAFHDIEFPSSGVPKLWEEIRHDHRHLEIRHGANRGIGIIFI